jgi:hypothetical protein
LSAILPPLLTVLGQALAKKAANVAHTLTTAGVTYTFSAPQGQADSMALKFTAADGGCNGTYTWSLASGAISATASVSLDLQGMTGTLTYDLALDGARGAAGPNSKLTYSANVHQPENATSTLQTTAVNGQIVSQTLTNTESNGTVDKFVFAIDSNGVTTVNGSTALSAVLSAVAAQPLTQGDLLDPGVLPLSYFMRGLPSSGIWPGNTVIAESWTNNGWTQIEGGYVTTFDSKWGLGETPYGLAQYSISVNVDGNGAVTSYSILGTLNNGPGGANGLISCTVDQIANTTKCYIDLQVPASVSAVVPPSSIDPNAIISMNSTITLNADGSVSREYTGSVANPDGSSQSWYENSSGVNSSTVTDSDGNTSTSTTTLYSDGTSTITIATTDSNQNGTIETIGVDANGNMTSDTTASTGDGGSGDVQAGDTGLSGSGDQDGDDDGSENESEDSG